MKIEHITLGGNSVIRDTADILQTTKRHFSTLDMQYESKRYIIPQLPFKIKVTATAQGAAFDLEVDGNPLITNLCCFEESQSEGILALVDDFADNFNKLGLSLKTVQPVTPNWLYSIIVNPFAMKPEVMQVAGEVELYIYERLYQAWKKS